MRLLLLRPRLSWRWRYEEGVLKRAPGAICIHHQQHFALQFSSLRRRPGHTLFRFLIHSLNSFYTISRVTLTSVNNRIYKSSCTSNLQSSSLPLPALLLLDPSRVANLAVAGLAAPRRSSLRAGAKTSCSHGLVDPLRSAIWCVGPNLTPRSPQC